MNSKLGLGYLIMAFVFGMMTFSACNEDNGTNDFSLLDDNNDNSTSDSDVDGDSDADGDADSDSDSDTDSQEEIVPYIIMGDQISADVKDEVMANSVESDGPGILVIYDDDDFQPGDALGYTAVSDGENHDVWVDLSRDFVHRERLWAVLYSDQGESGVFEPEIDPVFLWDQDKQVRTWFWGFDHIPITEFVFTSDQSLDAPADQVVIEQVSSEGSGWVVVYDDDEGAFGNVLGETQVPQEFSFDVPVSLNRSVMDGEILWVVLHDDFGIEGVFEPGVDTLSPEGCLPITSWSFSVSVTE